jgi:heme exporter protein CcmD
MSHDFYILLSYAVTFGLIGLVVIWTWLDGRARQRELKALEAAGVRRRSAAVSPDGAKP